MTHDAALNATRNVQDGFVRYQCRSVVFDRGHTTLRCHQAIGARMRKSSSILHFATHIGATTYHMTSNKEIT